MTDETRPIRPEVTDLLARLDPDEVAEALQTGSWATVMVDGRLLERDERELAASVTPAELDAVASQVALRIEMSQDLAGRFRELATLLAPVWSEDRTMAEAVEALSDEDEARAIGLLEGLHTLDLLVNPDAVTMRETAEAFLAGRLVVSEWTPDGGPRRFADVEPDPDRSPPTMAQASRVLVALVGEAGAHELADQVPRAWKAAWFDQAAVEVIDRVVDEGVAFGWLSENSDGTLDGDLDRLDDELGRALDRLGEGDDEP